MIKIALLNGYVEVESKIHKLDPRTKVIWLIALLLHTIATLRWWENALLLLLILVTHHFAGLSYKLLKGPAIVLVIVTIQIFIIQALFNHTGEILISHGWFTVYQNSVTLAATAALKLSCIVLATMQFLLWTRPVDLTLLLIEMRLPYRYAMLVGVAMRFLPLMEKELDAIFESQAVRGVDFSTILRKLRGLLPVTIPFLFKAFKRANETALAMELRGFGCHPKRTFYKNLNLTTQDTILITVIIFVTMLLSLR